MGIDRPTRGNSSLDDGELGRQSRAAGQRDLRVVVENGTAQLAWAENDPDEPAVEFDAAARQLFIWGRQPDSRGRLHSYLKQSELARLQALLSGY